MAKARFYPKSDVTDAASVVTDVDLLVAPAPGACGNAGQLACDILALNWNLRRVGAIDFEHVAPVVGRDALYDEEGDGCAEGSPAGSIAMACEVYAGLVKRSASDAATAKEEFLRVVVVQMRSDANVGGRRAFCREYVDFLMTFGDAKRVVLASSLPSTYGASEAQIGGTKLRCARGDSTFRAMCGAAEVREIEANIKLPDEEMAESVDPHWALVDTLNGRDAEERVGCVLAVCSEGDNSADGAAVALAIARSCGVKIEEPRADSKVPVTYIGPWRVPRSWEMAFGMQPVNRDMYY